MSGVVNEVDKLEVHILKIEKASMLAQAGLLMPMLWQLMVVLRALAVSK